MAGISFNVSDSMTPALRRLAAKYPEQRDAGLVEAGLAIWGDAVNVAPKPPVDTGLLRGSGNLSVSGKDISPPSGVEKDSSASAGAEGKPGQVVFGFNTPYAHRLHELGHYASHAVPGINGDSGPQFLRSKISRYKNDYVQLVAKKLQEWLR